MKWKIPGSYTIDRLICLYLSSLSLCLAKGEIRRRIVRLVPGRSTIDQSKREFLRRRRIWTVLWGNSYVSQEKRLVLHSSLPSGVRTLKELFFRSTQTIATRTSEVRRSAELENWSERGEDRGGNTFERAPKDILPLSLASSSASKASISSSRVWDLATASQVEWRQISGSLGSTVKDFLLPLEMFSQEGELVITWKRPCHVRGWIPRAELGTRHFEKEAEKRLLYHLMR